MAVIEHAGCLTTRASIPEPLSEEDIEIKDEELNPKQIEYLGACCVVAHEFKNGKLVLLQKEVCSYSILTEINLDHKEFFFLAKYQYTSYSDAFHDLHFWDGDYLTPPVGKWSKFKTVNFELRPEEYQKQMMDFDSPLHAFINMISAS